MKTKEKIAWDLPALLMTVGAIALFASVWLVVAIATPLVAEAGPGLVPRNLQGVYEPQDRVIDSILARAQRCFDNQKLTLIQKDRCVVRVIQRARNYYRENPDAPPIPDASVIPGLTLDQFDEWTEIKWNRLVQRTEERAAEKARS